MNYKKVMKRKDKICFYYIDHFFQAQIWLNKLKISYLK